MTTLAGLAALEQRVAAQRAAGDGAALRAEVEALLGYVRAARDLVVAVPGEGDALVLDPEQVAGIPITGLLLTLLAEETPSLQTLPAAAAHEALASVSIEVPEERAGDVYRAWQASRALTAAQTILGEMPVVDDAAETAWALALLEETWPTTLRLALERFVRVRTPSHPR